jgi:hypothetical protein
MMKLELLEFWAKKLEQRAAVSQLGATTAAILVTHEGLRVVLKDGKRRVVQSLTWDELRLAPSSFDVDPIEGAVGRAAVLLKATPRA